MIGIAQDKLASFEPAFVDELAAIMEWGFARMQADDGGSIYLRLSTRQLDQPARSLDTDLRVGIIDGAYWLKPPAPGAELAIAYMGAVAEEAIAAHAAVLEDIPGAGLLAVTSADRLHADWLAARQAGRRMSSIERLLAPLAPGAGLVTILDGHPATLSWLGAVAGQRIEPLGVDHFGQSGDLPDLYSTYGLDAGAILDAVARTCLR
jgi:pyruvate dehydrogenase E1 component